MLRLARPSACDGSSDLSFADPFIRKRKADRSCLMELGEGKVECIKYINSLPSANQNLFIMPIFRQLHIIGLMHTWFLLTDDEDFDTHWEIPDEPSDEMEISQSSVTVRSFGDR